MEKGIEEEEDELYKQTEKVADNVLSELDNMNASINMNSVPNSSTFNQNIDYNKLFDILYKAFLKALNSSRLTLDEDGFVRIVKEELYKVV